MNDLLFSYKVVNNNIAKSLNISFVILFFNFAKKRSHDIIIFDREKYISVEKLSLMLAMLRILSQAFILGLARLSLNACSHISGNLL